MWTLHTRDKHFSIISNSLVLELVLVLQSELELALVEYVNILPPSMRQCTLALKLTGDITTSKKWSISGHTNRTYVFKKNKNNLIFYHTNLVEFMYGKFWVILLFQKSKNIVLKTS